MNCDSNVDSSKKTFYKGVTLELDNILIWELSSDDSRSYMISIEGYSDENCSKRVMISSEKSESSVINYHKRIGDDIFCCSVATRMTEKEQDKYNEALSDGDYSSCLDNLFSIERHLNETYGFDVKAITKKKRKNR